MRRTWLILYIVVGGGLILCGILSLIFPVLKPFATLSAMPSILPLCWCAQKLWAPSHYGKLIPGDRFLAFFMILLGGIDLIGICLSWFCFRSSAESWGYYFVMLNNILAGGGLLLAAGKNPPALSRTESPEETEP